MKPIEEVTACFVDYGVFLSFAEKFAEKAKRTFYYSPWEWEFCDVKDCKVGTGIPGIERLDDFLEPAIFKEIDLFVFPDIVYGGLQRHLISLGKKVWGSKGVDDFELYRTRFIEMLDQLGLDHVPTLTLRGLSSLAEHLKKVENKWVKINRYRANMETWHHHDYERSRRKLENLRVEFGPFADYVVFVVQDAIEGDDEHPVLEIGYDGWCIDGRFPPESFQGYEKKNKCYLGSHLKYKDLPEPVRAVNEAIAPVLAEWEYRAMMSTEIRMVGDDFYFIDPTFRTPGLTGEHQLEAVDNMPEIIWAGANGMIVPAKFNAQFSGETGIHYTGDKDGWKTIGVPEKAQPWAKLYRYAIKDGLYHFPPCEMQELGVIVGMGNSIREAIAHLQDTADQFADEEVDIDTSGFADLLGQIDDAEEEGVIFSDQKVPPPESVIA